MKTEQNVTQADINAAARGMNMLGMTPADLETLADRHTDNPAFASRVIRAAARQMRAAKLRMGAAEYN